MNAASWANVIAGLALLISTAVAIRAEAARRSSRDEAEKAEQAATRATEASERSAAALEKMAGQWAESLSRAEKRDQRPWDGPLPSRPADPVVHWTVDRIDGRRHLLRNIGQATAYDVHLRIKDATGTTEPRPGNVQPGETTTFLAIGSLKTGTPELILSWRDQPNGDVQEWRRPLP